MRLKFIPIIFSFICFSMNIFSQSMTTSAINGTITDQDGSTLIGATVKAVHIPSGTTFGTTTRADGKYNIANMRVGGPYTITISYVGYANKELNNIFLELGKNLQLNLTLSSKSVELSNIDVLGKRTDIISSDRTGASTNVNAAVIEDFPTISRSFQDFYKFNPQFSGSPIAGSTNSASGRNNRYNNIQIDGAVYNDLFGLASSGTPGGQTSTNPISLDAIQEFQVVIAPYDVRLGGFTGGGVNAITRSGTNQFSGSAFGYYRNQDLVGKSPDDAKTKYKNFNEYQTGFRFGGPIMRDQLFFFVNAEFTKRREPIDNIAITQALTGKNDSLSNAFQNILKTKYGYNAKGYNSFTLTRPSTKLFGKLDWNLSENHKLSFRYNYVDANDDNMPRNIQNILFNDRNYVLTSVTNSAVMQLNSTFSNQMTNEFILGYTAINDKRDIDVVPFPSISVTDNSVNFKAGAEEFSIANKLDQNILELTDNFSYYMGQHVITVGTHNEFFNFKNLFIQNMYGFYTFRSMSDFEAGRFNRYQYSYSLTNDPMQTAKFNVAQYGVYAQDEYTVFDNLKLTGGLRIDVPLFIDKPAYNPSIEQLLNYKTNEVPSGQVLFSPRIGFNLDLYNDKQTQIRGGVGIFTGRVPYVWISNQYSNTGIEFARVDYTRRANDTLFFNPDPYAQFKAGYAGIPAGSSEIDLTDKNFKMPQLFRLNAAIDQVLPYDYVATVEFVYSKALNDIYYQDLNLGAQNTSISGIGGRPVYADTSKGSYVMRKVSQSFTNVILLKNTSAGYSYNLSVQVQNRPTDIVYTSVGYVYGTAKDKNNLSSSRAISNYQFNPVPGNPNDPPLTTSTYETKHRIFAAISYNVEWMEGWNSTISLFYNGQTGRPFSYTYNGDVNGDNNTSNDLIYIPKNANDIVLTTNNWADLDKYINNDPYLSKHRGQIAERNGAREPWIHQIDFKFVQDIPVFRNHKFQLSVDILNLANLIKSTWGWVKTVPNQTDNLLVFKGLNASGVPTFAFTNKTDPFQKEALLSRWQMQLGLRYTF